MKEETLNYVPRKGKRPHLLIDVVVKKYPRQYNIFTEIGWNREVQLIDEPNIYQGL